MNAKLLLFCRSFSTLIVLAAVLATGPTLARAQAPLGNELVLNSSRDYYEAPYSIACDAMGNCAVVWQFFIQRGTEQDNYISAKSFSPDGQILNEREIRVNREASYPKILALSRGFTVVWKETIWDREHPNGYYSVVMTQVFDEHLESQGEAISTAYSPPMYESLVSAGKVPGGYVALGAGQDLPDGTSEASLGVFLLFYGDDGQALGAPRQVNQDTAHWDSVDFVDLAVDGRGNVIVPFRRRYVPDTGDSDVFIRRFSPDGQPLGPEIRVNSYLPGDQRNPNVAAAPNGDFLVTWQSEGQDGDREGVYGQFFAADGTRRGHEIRINDVTLSAQRFPRVAADPHGNFIVTWRSFILDPQSGHILDWDLKGRLFRPDGTPVAGEILINQQRELEQGLPLVAFAPNGTFFVTWQSSTGPLYDTEQDVHARRFAASPGEEPCAVVGPQLLCDTGRTGGALELQTTFARRPGDVTLLGDWDGDGREDVCAFREGRFRCDLDHEGPPAEAAHAFGRATDIPLLGDVDGDGRADPCVRRKRRLLCDTARNGGRAEVIVTLGQGTETPLLGDLDGDGKDGLCLVQGGQWTCLTRAGVRTSFVFGTADDAPTLGDLDRDGRSDPCLLRDGVLLCDTAHDGGVAEGMLTLEVSAGARPVFGNLDGL